MRKAAKILLVDDQDDFRTLMSAWLESKGYRVITGADGKEATKAVKTKKPDVVLLDLDMPIMNGPTALKKIREFNKDLPVIIISVHADSPLAREAITYGISGVFYKGKNFEDALPLLETAIRMQKKRK